MRKQKTYTLRVKDGKETRKFDLPKEEFDRFLMMFEEYELVDLTDFDISNIKLVQAEPSAQ